MQAFCSAAAAEELAHVNGKAQRKRIRAMSSEDKEYYLFLYAAHVDVLGSRPRPYLVDLPDVMEYWTPKHVMQPCCHRPPPPQPIVILTIDPGFLPPDWARNKGA